MQPNKLSETSPKITGQALACAPLEILVSAAAREDVQRDTLCDAARGLERAARALRICGMIDAADEAFEAAAGVWSKMHGG